MSRFLTPLQVEVLDDGRHYRVIVPFEFASSVLERIIRVPAGFITDFASTPRIVWALIPPTGRWSKAAVVHDDCYQHPEMITPPVTWMQANRALLEGCEALNVGWLTRYLIFWGVCAFGWIVWNRYRQQERRTIC
jgi:hypothetical protein